MKTLLIIASLTAFSTGAIAGDLSCEEIAPVAVALAANSKVYSEIVRWCIDNDVNQPACQKLNEASQTHQVAELNAAASISTFALALKCRGVDMG